MPFLSIVIANYNYGRFLDEAIQSVLAQSCQDFELIIVDGGSTDNSVEVIKKYAKGLSAGTRRDDPSIVHLHLSPSPITYWVSEKDKGQSDAFNKGFAKASGRFLTWLNADDVMLPGTIAKLKVAVEKHPRCEWFVGGCFWLDKEMRILQCRRAQAQSRILTRGAQVGVWGPSSFFTKKIFDAVGGVDERFKYTMDSELWHKFTYKYGARYRVFADYAWGLRLHEDAKMSGQNFDPKQMDPNHPRWHQIDQEVEWMLVHYQNRYGQLRRQLSRFDRLLSKNWLMSGLSILDSRRFRGKHYLELFK